MASTQTRNSKDNGKKLEYKPVKFDVNEIAPDAPAGAWMASIPPGKCKVQPTKEDRYPMLIVPLRLDSTDEDGEEFERALGTELSVMIVFFGDEKARAARMSKLRLRQLCEACDIDLDVIPKELSDPENDLEPLIHALERKKLKVYTRITTRKDTGEEVTEVQFNDPNKPLRAKDGGEDDEEPEGGDEGSSSARGAKKKTTAKKGTRR